MSDREPVVFKRGSTFSYLFKIPENIPEEFFKDWIVSAQLRREKSEANNGILADINTLWVDGSKSKVLLLYHSMTDKWNLGPAELDILFESTGGHKIRSNTIPFIISRGITK